MLTFFKKFFKFRHISKTLCALLAWVGVIAIFQGLMRLDTTVPISLQLDSILTVGLCFLSLSGFYFVFSQGTVNKITYVFPSIPLVLATVALLNSPYLVEGGILEGAHSTPLSPLVWVGIILASLSCYTKPAPSTHSALNIFCNGIVLFIISILFLINELFDLSATYGWNQLTNITFYPALGFFLLGLMHLFVYRLSKKYSVYHELDLYPKVIFVIGIILTGFISNTFLRYEKSVMQTTINDISSNTQAYITNALHLNFQAINRITERWKTRNGINYQTWQQDAKAYFEDFKTYHALLWVDTNEGLQWSMPEENEIRSRLSDLLQSVPIKQVLQAAKTENLPKISAPITIDETDTGFMFVSPIYSNQNQSFEGYHIALFSLNKLFSSLNHEDINTHLIWSFAYKKNAVTTPGHLAFSSFQRSMQTNYNLSIGDGHWSLILTPTSKFINNHQTITPLLILILGFILSVFLTLIIRYWLFFLKYQSSYKDLLLFSGDGIIGLDTKGLIKVINPSALKMLDSNEKDLLGQSFTKLIQHTSYSGTPMKAEDNAILNSLNSGTTLNAENEVFWTSHQNPILVEYACRPIIELGKIKGAVINFKDVTERKEIEDKLRNSNLKLIRMNQQMNEFNYIAAHDLKAPLRGIQNAADFLIEDLGPNPPEQVLKDVAYIKSSTKKMIELCRDLLTYSRSSDQSLDIKTHDLTTCVQEALNPIHNFIEQSKAVITIEPLPKAYIDFTLGSQIFQNLIQNAVKYCKKTPHVRIYTEREQPDAVVIAIQDNGIGIDPQFRDKVFAPFQRLHTQEEFQGSGIGLAIVKKFAEVLKGEVWFESDGTSGTTFFIRFPKNTKNNMPYSHERTSHPNSTGS